MGAVDTIITKAGPGTIAEALISGLPILLNGNVPCQVGARLCTAVISGAHCTSGGFACKQTPMVQAELRLAACGAVQPLQVCL